MGATHLKALFPGRKHLKSAGPGQEPSVTEVRVAKSALKFAQRDAKLT